MPGRAILDQCTDPAATRRHAALNEPVPCHRCLAYRPETESGCHLLNFPPRDPMKPVARPVQTKLFT